MFPSIEWMWRRIRQNVEAIIYAGLRPGASQSGPHNIGGAPWRELLERVLGPGPAPADPLYLSKRTAAQKVRTAVLVATPAVLILLLVGLALSGHFRKRPASAPETTTVIDLPADFGSGAIRPSASDADVAEIRIEPGARVTGTLTNKTEARSTFELAVDFTDSRGSRVGSATYMLDGVPPGTSVFNFPVKTDGVAYALVREIRRLNPTSGSSR